MSKTSFQQSLNNLDFAISQLENYLQRFHIDKQHNRDWYNYNLAVRELVAMVRQCMTRLK